MTKRFQLLAAVLLLGFYCTAQLTVRHLLTENLSDPIGLDTKIPRFSWQLDAPERNELQTAYEIRVTRFGNGKTELWNSGKVLSGQSVHVTYGGPATASGHRYFWQVRVWDNKGRGSAWSAPAWWQTGLLDSADWTAKWIQPGYKEEAAERPSPLFRKEFANSKKLRSATAYITAHGLYEAMINGRRIGDAFLTPGWTSYEKRLQYQVYDVTDLVRPGK